MVSPNKGKWVSLTLPALILIVYINFRSLAAASPDPATIYTAYPLRVKGGTGADPRWHWERGWLHPGQVASTSHTETTIHTHIYTFAEIEFPINLSCIYQYQSYASFLFETLPLVCNQSAFSRFHLFIHKCSQSLSVFFRAGPSTNWKHKLRLFFQAAG